MILVSFLVFMLVRVIAVRYPIFLVIFFSYFAIAEHQPLYQINLRWKLFSVIRAVARTKIMAEAISMNRL